MPLILDPSLRPKPIFHPPALWLQIEQEFIRGEGSTRTLAAKHGVKLSTLQARRSPARKVFTSRSNWSLEGMTILDLAILRRAITTAGFSSSKLSRIAKFTTAISIDRSSRALSDRRNSSNRPSPTPGYSVEATCWLEFLLGSVRGSRRELRLSGRESLAPTATVVMART